MRLIALLLLAAGIAIPQEKAGDFNIRFEPMAVLQSNAPIPFHIQVKDARNQPLVQAKVTLQIETLEHNEVEVFKAADIGAGVYVAKPTFHEAGEWIVIVTVKRDDETAARSINFIVADPHG